MKDTVLFFELWNEGGFSKLQCTTFVFFRSSPRDCALLASLVVCASRLMFTYVKTVFCNSGFLISLTKAPQVSPFEFEEFVRRKLQLSHWDVMAIDLKEADSVVAPRC